MESIRSEAIPLGDPHRGGVSITEYSELPGEDEHLVGGAVLEGRGMRPQKARKAARYQPCNYLVDKPEARTPNSKD